MALVPFAGDMGIASAGGMLGPVASLGTLSLASGKRKAQRHVMDPELARQIFKFYYEEEPLVNVCKVQRFSLTFVGEMHIEWGGGDIEPITLDSPSERDQLETLFKRALEYRDMFGMVPVKLSRRGAKKKNNKPMIWIPPFGSGNFVMYYDAVKMETTVVYEVAVERTVKKTSSTQRTKQAVVKALDVFVWPGYEPSVATKRFRSRVSSLLPRYTDIVELRSNLRDADFRASHPVVFTQSRPDTRNLQEMTEEELLGLTDESAPGPEESRRYSRNTHRAIQAEELAASVNQAAREPIGTGNGTVGAPITRSAVDPATQRVVKGVRDRTWDGAIQPLPHGEEMARIITPQSRADLAAFESRYEDLVCKTMGIPAAYISGAVGSQRMRGEADQLRNNVRAAVLQDRADINLFYAWAYEMTHRSVDNDMMVRALIAADESERADPGPDEKKRISKVRANIGKISAMPFRTRVVFSEDPLPKKVELPVLAAAAAAGALTQLELVNLLRAEIGVPSIDKEHELIRENDENAKAEPILTITAASSSSAGAQQQQQQQQAPEKKKKATKRKNSDGGAASKEPEEGKDKGTKERPTKKRR
jgi:hypothetical protein